MARIYQTGFEMGHLGIVDIASAGNVVTTPTPGSWSTYAFQQAGYFSSATVYPRWWV